MNCHTKYINYIKCNNVRKLYFSNILCSCSFGLKNRKNVKNGDENKFVISSPFFLFKGGVK